MSYVSDKLGSRRVYDADGHLIEMPDWLASYADERTRKLIPPMIRVDQTIEELAEEGLPPDLHPSTFADRPAAERIAAAEERFMSSKHFASLGGVDPSERTRAMDRLGVYRQFVFATLATTQCDPKSFGRHHLAHPDLLWGGTSAHNRGMVDFCSHDERLIPTGYVPLEDPERSVKALEEALELGCGAIVIPHSIPDERSWSHPDYDAVWARMAEADVPMLLHIGSGELSLQLPDAVYNNGRPTVWAAGDDTWKIEDLLRWHWTTELMLQALVIDGVFERFPGLRCGVIELRTHWLPSFMERLDFAERAARYNPTYRKETPLPLRWTDYIRRQVKFTPWCMGGDPLADMIEKLEDGERLFMFSTDYPHAEGGVDPIGTFESEIEKLPAERRESVRERFYTRNFEELMGIEAA